MPALCRSLLEMSYFPYIFQMSETDAKITISTKEVNIMQACIGVSNRTTTKRAAAKKVGMTERNFYRCYDTWVRVRRTRINPENTTVLFNVAADAHRRIRIYAKIPTVRYVTAVDMDKNRGAAVCIVRIITDYKCVLAAYVLLRTSRFLRYTFCAWS